MTGELSPEALSAVDKARKLVFHRWMGSAVKSSVKLHPGDPAAQLSELSSYKSFYKQRLAEAEPIIHGYGRGSRVSSPDGEAWLSEQVAAIGFREDFVTNFIDVGTNGHYQNLETGEVLELGVVATHGFTDEELQAVITELPLDRQSNGLPAGHIDPLVYLRAG